MESQCWKDKEIWYEKCREVPTTVDTMCWFCEADAVPVCKTKTRQISITVVEKNCEPRTETGCNPAKKQPTQEKVHQEKCLHHDSKGNMQASVVPQSYGAPGYTG